MIFSTAPEPTVAKVNLPVLQSFQVGIGTSGRKKCFGGHLCSGNFLSFHITGKLIQESKLHLVVPLAKDGVSIQASSI
jgi:hypothetical protein